MVIWLCQLEGALLDEFSQGGEKPQLHLIHSVDHVQDVVMDLTTMPLRSIAFYSFNTLLLTVCRLRSQQLYD